MLFLQHFAIYGKQAGVSDIGKPNKELDGAISEFEILQDYLSL